MNIYKFRSTVE